MAANASLAALYRPQTFAEVVGQDMVKSILSRAAREDRVAPAYLLSGTRGVGKTTIARIFAKALNCEHAPTGEPCNQCEACRRITQGSFVDVVEIDGASNRGIDDIRRLRDAVGYAPLEGRYKVFIIDEAHMLTKEAFNALLKTLEEPPARVTFILATTEQHKFPVTIVSRCQHFVFRQIPEATLEAHICSILGREGRAFEQEAAHLIARRAAGSVRDSMSLLGQVLALGCAPDEALTARMAREVLGLAGQEVMDRILAALASHDTTSITLLVRELLAQGADMGFFLRELGSLWRDLFLIRQAGRDAAQELDLPPAERDRLADMASRFTLTYIHAAWQMTLDSQRRILTSLEPSAGLELLLLNLAMLPRLLPLEELGAHAAPAGMSGAQDAARAERSAASSVPFVPAERVSVPEGTGRESVFSPPPAPAAPSPSTDPAARPTTPTASLAEPSAPHPAAPAPASSVVPPMDEVPLSAYEDADMYDDGGIPEPAFVTAAPRSSAPPRAEAPRAFTPPSAPARASSAPSAFQPPKGAGAQSARPFAPPAAQGRSDDAIPLTGNGKTAQTQPALPNQGAAEWKGLPVDPSLTWEDFLTSCEGRTEIPVPVLRQCTGEVRGGWLVLQPLSQVIGQQLQRPEKLRVLESLAASWAGRPLQIAFRAPQKIVRTEAELKEEYSAHPVIKRLQSAYDAMLMRCVPVGR
ncbi:DNA polymerase III subunit gamma/tau [Mailhella sp.]|uniref:DNA polymerase III subunit gamma/tau n=1 Tax=Mailhella sp. TaxID=1981029 RepID=UPI00406466EB